MLSLHSRKASSARGSPWESMLPSGFELDASCRVWKIKRETFRQSADSRDHPTETDITIPPITVRLTRSAM